MCNMSSGREIFLIFLLFLIHVKRIKDGNALNKNVYYYYYYYCYYYYYYYILVVPFQFFSGKVIIFIDNKVNYNILFTYDFA